jgi:quinoprotein glucose dehydrogenase
MERPAYGGRGGFWPGILLLWALLGTVLALGAQARPARGKKVVFIAGKKSHGPGEHEYEKGCRLLARCLESSPNLKGIRTEVCADGWPEDPRTLDDADSIVIFCDGSDHSEADHPLLQGDRLAVLGRAMARGAGLVLLHYTLFVPSKRGGPEFLDWAGGYFDYETGTAANHWYSKIRTAATEPAPATPGHPVSRGLQPFPLREEYYYGMRFREGDRRLTPILTTPLPDEPGPQTVAWAVQRQDGGRGFAYTGGHFHANWEVEGLRKMVLNGIAWTARREVPQGGVQSVVSDEPSSKETLRALILTGRHHPAHDWRATTEALKEGIGRDRRFQFDVWEDPERLATEDLSRYDLLIQNYNNWERPGLSEAAREKLLRFVRDGKGLVVLHFANGAFLDWPDYRRLSRRTWIEGTSGHDPYGPFRVEIGKGDHPITRGIPAYNTTDELYFKQQGELPAEPLVFARSRVTGQEEPLAFVYEEGKGRVFQILLGHDAQAVRTGGTAALIRRGAAWVARREPADLPVEATPAARLAEGRFGKALNPSGATVTAASKPAYQGPPLTVECWTKLQGKSGFNILVANGPKESSAHWEIYTTAGTGTFSAYLPGVKPSAIDSGVPIVDGQWHHVAMSYTPGRVRLFVDARAVADQAVSPGTGTPLPGPLYFGAYPPQGLGCDGLIDEVRITRSAREIVRVPEAPPEVEEETLGLWRFDTLDGGRLPDASRENNPALAGSGLSGPEPAKVTQTGPASFPVVRSSVDWANVGNDKGGMRYSPLKQINRENVKNLEVAWVYHSGDGGPANATTLECTPIVVEGVMYLTTAQVSIAALDAATGRELWKFNARGGGVNRGVAYWSDRKPGGQRRILSGLADGRLISLDARTGKPDEGFGKGGSVDLRAGIERDISRVPYGCSSAPMVFEDRVMLPFLSSESQPGAPGDIRAFDVRTGKEAWRFHTVPRPGEVGNETWEGDSWKERAGVNPWSGFTLDDQRGILFCGTGSAASDFYGADRKGRNLFANCTLALDARTGKRLWHFQTLHHDLWDHDLPCPPVLVQVEHGGRKIPAAAQVTKTGYLFLFNRRTGEPLFPVEERPVPASDVAGEQAWPTQPFPVKPPPFSRQSIGEDDLSNISPETNASVREKFRHLRGGPAFTPPSVPGTVTIPGFHGGATWSGASFDPGSGLLYVNSNNVPNVTTLVKLPAGVPPYNFTGYFRFLDENGYPAVKPPWGNLTAIDLSRGEIAWQVVLGEFPELTARGVPQTGTENFGGTIVTAGGLVFIGGTKDEKFHAFDKRTGRLLWDYKLDAGGYATPCTYSVNGRQFVVIAAGGGGKLGTKSGDGFVAFALPRR